MKRYGYLAAGIILTAAGALSAQETAIEAAVNEIASSVSAERMAVDIRTLSGFHTRHTFSDTLSETRGVGAARRWLYRELQKISAATGGRMNVYYDRFEQSIPERYRESAGKDILRTANVVAVIPGMRSRRMLIITGHYDSRNETAADNIGYAPGANDDASGIAALLELARIFAGRTIDNTLVLAAVTGEEQGLYGSTHMAEDAVTNNLQVEGVITNDMIGNTEGGNGHRDNTLLRCFSADPADSPSRHLARYIEAVIDRYYPPLTLKMIFRLDRFGRGGDHAPFVRAGFAGVRFTEPWENYRIQHSGLDVPALVDTAYLQRTAGLNAAVAWYWSMSPAPPLVVSVSRTDDYRTVVSFTCEEPPERVKGFILRIRETDQLRWQENRLICDPEKAESRRRGPIFRISVDNRDMDYYIFGIAVVNEAGYESLTSTYDRDLIRKTARSR